jgi:hypothetical protein
VDDAVAVVFALVIDREDDIDDVVEEESFDSERTK